MRRDIPFLQSNVLEEALVNLGYNPSYIRLNVVCLKAKQESYHFEFTFKKCKTIVHGHIDTGLFHSHPIFESKELSKEYIKIIAEYKKVLPKYTREIPEWLLNF
jgi:hypothetical protein